MSYTAQREGFYLAFLLPTIVFMLCPFVLYFGKKRYTLYPPTGSVLSKSFRILMYCAKGIWFSPKSLAAPDFWEKAKPSNVSAEEQARLSWMTYDDAFVDEVARGFQACRVVSSTHSTTPDRSTKVLPPPQDDLLYPLLVRLQSDDESSRQSSWCDGHWRSPKW